MKLMTVFLCLFSVLCHRQSAIAFNLTSEEPSIEPTMPPTLAPTTSSFITSISTQNTQLQITNSSSTTARSVQRLTLTTTSAGPQNNADDADTDASTTTDWVDYLNQYSAIILIGAILSFLCCIVICLIVCFGCFFMQQYNKIANIDDDDHHKKPHPQTIIISNSRIKYRNSTSLQVAYDQRVAAADVDDRDAYDYRRRSKSKSKSETAETELMPRKLWKKKSSVQPGKYGPDVETPKLVPASQMSQSNTPDGVFARKRGGSFDIPLMVPGIAQAAVEIEASEDELDYDDDDDDDEVGGVVGGAGGGHVKDESAVSILQNYTETKQFSDKLQRILKESSTAGIPPIITEAEPVVIIDRLPRQTGRSMVIRSDSEVDLELTPQSPSTPEPEQEKEKKIEDGDGDGDVHVDVVDGDADEDDGYHEPKDSDFDVIHSEFMREQTQRASGKSHAQPQVGYGYGRLGKDRRKLTAMSILTHAHSQQQQQRVQISIGTDESKMVDIEVDASESESESTHSNSPSDGPGVGVGVGGNVNVKNNDNVYNSDIETSSIDSDSEIYDDPKEMSQDGILVMEHEYGTKGK